MIVGKELKRGFFIGIEGGEGAGKDTQITKLGAYVRGLGFDVVETFEPGAIEPDVRTRALEYKLDPMEQARIFSAERKRHVEELIRPALRNGNIVISNRFKDSMLAYQGYGHGVSLDFLNAANQEACGDTVPSLVLFLDVDPKVGLERVRRRGEILTTFEREKMEFHQRVYDGFHELAKKDPVHWRIVDAALSIEEVWMQVKVTTDQALRARGLVTNGTAK